MPNNLECQTWTVNETAKILGVQPGHLYDLVKRDKIRHLRIGAKIVFPKKIVEEMLSVSS